MAANSLKNRTNNKNREAGNAQTKELEQPQEATNQPAQAKERQQEKEAASTRRKRRKKSRIRRFPIWVRILTVLVLIVLSLVAGLMVGYGVIGDGNPLDALHKDTWQHIIDIVEKK